MSLGMVERQLHRNREKLPEDQLRYPCPQVLGIDEPGIQRRRAKGHQVAVTLANPQHHRVDEIFKGKSATMPEANLSRLKGREKVVCRDLNSPFRSIVQRLFPRAKTVAD